MNSLIARATFGLTRKCQAALFCLGVVAAASAMAHEDHGSRHGGFVMMFLEMHFEIVVPDQGGVEIYYSDPLRTPLPAAVVSDVAVEIERAGNNIESVYMAISDSGEAWQGESAPVEDPETIVRVAFLFQGEPFVLDIPAAVFPEEDAMNMPMHDMPMDDTTTGDMPMNHNTMPQPGCENDCAG
ncbi:MAG: hypothetical protein PsegKO_09750 [Pseudohongiellaceae bacterium]